MRRKDFFCNLLPVVSGMPCLNIVWILRCCSDEFIALIHPTVVVYPHCTWHSEQKLRVKFSLPMVSFAFTDLSANFNLFIESKLTGFVLTLRWSSPPATISNNKLCALFSISLCLFSSCSFRFVRNRVEIDLFLLKFCKHFVWMRPRKYIIK